MVLIVSNWLIWALGAPCIRFLGAPTRCQHLDIKFNPVISMDQKQQNIMILVISTVCECQFSSSEPLGSPWWSPQGLQTFVFFFFLPNSSILRATLLLIWHWSIDNNNENRDFSDFQLFLLFWAPLRAPGGSPRGSCPHFLNFHILLSNISQTRSFPTFILQEKNSFTQKTAFKNRNFR